MSRLDLTLDCADPTAQAEFWKLALGYEDEPPPAPFATREEWLRSYDVPEDELDGGAWLRDPRGVGPRLALLAVPEPKTAKNRLHLDIRVDAAGDRWPAVLDLVARLEAAGARRLAEFEGHHVVLADPEGNEFCVA
jgi:catechol 2,3-dioxygenase-like lactoylglutathione lyase family enzyme